MEKESENIVVLGKEYVRMVDADINI